MEEYLKGLENGFFDLLKGASLTYQTCSISNMAQPCGFTSSQYSNAIFQKAYLLKYVHAYGLDYKNLYKKLENLSPTLNQGGALNILSIGCGGGIDLAAAKSVFNNANVIYVGVDAIYWDDRVGINEPGASYHNYGIDNIDDSVISSADIVIFPRSITDIAESSLINFAERLIKLNKNSFYILWAHVHSNTSANSQLNDGIDRINAMIKVIENSELLVELAEDSEPNVSENISYRNYNVKEACNNNCYYNNCNFIAVKNINDKGYHHIIKVMKSEQK
ncbi:hypothetical protein [Aliivibrio sifiae]|uniref:Methyltransferase domain-containing protein n=1 Tax=Aliivibrio sifiae TaxID=566293 RepID=A0A2S7X3C7_9GAMM|nr:hypothetical protein [Aliivibrio sifiae]PQJ84519.1 hypothetical protein BTO22_13435 [Aliivibrio sifiae]